MVVAKLEISDISMFLIKSITLYYFREMDEGTGMIEDQVEQIVIVILQSSR